MELNYEKRGYLLEDFRLFHLRDSQGTAVDYHYHEFYKLLLLISGSGRYAVGFGTYSSFSRAFQKVFGTTPTGRPLQYRNHVEPID